MIYFIVGLYLLVGVFFSYYGTSFLRVGWDKKFRGLQEPMDYFIMWYFYLCITPLWLGFVIVLSFVNFLQKIFHPDEETIVADLHEDFIGVINHQCGELNNPIERW